MLSWLLLIFVTYSVNGQPDSKLFGKPVIMPDLTLEQCEQIMELNFEFHKISQLSPKFPDRTVTAYCISSHEVYTGFNRGGKFKSEHKSQVKKYINGEEVKDYKHGS